MKNYYNIKVIVDLNFKLFDKTIFLENFNLDYKTITIEFYDKSNFTNNDYMKQYINKLYDAIIIINDSIHISVYDIYNYKNSNYNYNSIIKIINNMIRIKKLKNFDI